MVWETLKPNFPGWSAMSLLMSVPLPTPEGPQMTTGLGLIACFERGGLVCFYCLRPMRSSLEGSGLNWKLLATMESVAPRARSA